MSAFEEELHACQSCGETVSVNQAVCDRCFWASPPSTPLGDVVKRHEAAIAEANVRVDKPACEHCGGGMKCVATLPEEIWVCEPCEEVRSKDRAREALESAKASLKTALGAIDMALEYLG